MNLFLNQNLISPGERKRVRFEFLLRGAAMFLALFTFTNLFGAVMRPDFDANIWWIDLRWLPAWLGQMLLSLIAITLLAYAIALPRSRPIRLATASICIGTAFVTLGNSLNFFALVAQGALRSIWLFPFSLLVTLLLARIGVSCLHRAYGFRPLSLRSLGFAGTSCVLCTLLFPLLQMFCFGKTDYRRPADITVVLGARVYRDGRVSDALADRVRTACELYRTGLTRNLLMSGGPGDGATDEPAAMKRMAESLGVKSEDILLDHQGRSTALTVKNTEALFARMRPQRVMVVSHFYHLPRIKLEYARAGRNVYTVPAKESYVLRQLPFNMAREVAAVWVYYFRPLVTRPALNVQA